MKCKNNLIYEINLFVLTIVMFYFPNVIMC
jgi:hypothetical protein